MTDPSERWRFFVGFLDELDLEVEVIEADPDSRDLPCMKQALRMIDVWAVEGTLDERVAEVRAVHEVLRAQVVPLPKRYDLRERFDEARMADPAVRQRLRDWDNLMAGLDSPDPEQRRSFEEAFSVMEHMSLLEGAPILRLLERAKKPGGNGRPAARPPWRNVHEAMDHMRKLVAGGATVIEAAHQAAVESPGRGTRDNRVRYFVQLFEKKCELRK